jgi:aminoglycoside/choline kinase family phosphotransferase
MNSRSTLEPGPTPDGRLEAGLAWSAAALDRTGLEVSPVAGDASFRRYFRLHDNTSTWILMDAPPDQEDSRPFVEVDQRLLQAGVHAPQILAADLAQGFLLLEDFGDTLFRDILDSTSAHQWFPRIFGVLEAMATGVDATGLPAYGRQKLAEELELFPKWYLQRHKGITLSCEDWDVWEALCTRLILSAQSQPQVFVHRDFHSCNLLHTSDDRIAVIDFQDGVQGPWTYDLASLLWDRYIAWPRSRLEAWMEEFRQRLAPDTDPQAWVRWCDWMGLQRNLKIVGIFARLRHRDDKKGYVEMIPQFWAYVREALPRYPEFAEFEQLLERLKCAP